MIYPKFIKEKDIIGVTAPSDGIVNKEKLYRLDSANKKMNELGFSIKETPDVRKSQNGRSTFPKYQSKELMELFQNDEVSAIICATGGDFLLEMLSYIDWDIIRKNPKWLQGYSDPTGLLYTITTNLDIATIYGNNFASFGMNPWHESLSNNIEILQGNRVAQSSFSKYEKDYQEYIIGDEPYYLTENVYWQNLNNEEEIIATGRIIGGCIDCLNDLFGTKYDKTNDFIEKYKNDGIIWYFDNFDFSSEQIIRTMWKFKENGWFKYTKCILFGRNIREYSYCEISFKEALQHSFKELNIPIIIDSDIGHVSPRLTIINGSIATITSKDGKGTITFQFK